MVIKILKNYNTILLFSTSNSNSIIFFFNWKEKFIIFEKRDKSRRKLEVRASAVWSRKFWKMWAGLYNYKYNGKELQETGMYAMDWRNYMPDIGRFAGQDRFTEVMPDWTPYRFAFNNPIWANILAWAIEPKASYLAKTKSSSRSFPTVKCSICLSVGIPFSQSFIIFFMMRKSPHLHQE